MLIYFSTAPVPQDRLTDDQFQQLQRFKTRLQSEGLLGVFNGVEHLREQVRLHVTSVVAGLLEHDRGQPSPTDATRSLLDLLVGEHLHALGRLARLRWYSDLAITVSCPFLLAKLLVEAAGVERDRSAIMN